MTSTPSTVALEQWLRTQNAIFHPSLHILSSPTSGIHMRTSHPLPPGTTLATSPHSLALSYLSALVDDDWPVFRNQGRRLRSEAIGFFYLMAQWLNRSGSFWKPYLDTLPPPPGEQGDGAQPLFWEGQGDVAWLGGTDVWHTICARREVYERYYEEGIGVLKEGGVDTKGFTW